MFKRKSGNAIAHSLSKEIQGLFLLGWSVLILLSLFSYSPFKPSHNWLGLIGNTLAWFLHYGFGFASFLIPIFLGSLGLSFLIKKAVPELAFKICYFIFLLLSLSILFSVLGHLLNLSFYLGGVPSFQLYIGFKWINLHLLLGTVGTFLVFFTLGLLSGLLLTGISPMQAIGFFKIYFLKVWSVLKKSCVKIKTWEVWKKFKKKKLCIPDSPPTLREEPFRAPVLEQPFLRKHPLKEITLKAIPEKPSPVIIAEKDEEEEIIPIQPPVRKEEPPKRIDERKPEDRRKAAIEAQKLILGDFSLYKLPPSTLLTQAKRHDQTIVKNDLRRHADLLEETLLSFGIEAKVGEIHCGPTITSFEVHPAIGVKVQKIKALENDIALNMQAKSIRIIAPIPGKAAVGIEIPNPRPQEVGFREMLEAYQALDKKYHIPVLLGKMVNGDDVANDLTKWPHCIIAGATGSGKSVCINTLVMSIIMNMRPDEVKLVLVDPKKVELTAYSNLPHMLAPVITEPQGACAALNFLVKEMENRYEIFRQIGARNILSFNHREINQEFEASLGIPIPQKLPYIVVIIDELADLMMVSSSDIETPIARIAQMARAVGIHLVLATQRPSREVITGLIKANFPTRIAFKVASRVNSQIIIDDTGAEALMGNGDMLFLPPGASSLMRAQGAFIRDEDINKVIKFICDQVPAQYVIPSFDQYKDKNRGDSFAFDDEVVDALYEQALGIVLETGNASTTFLQRKLKIGYARAASLMDQLESRGVIGPQEGAKPRKILYPSNKGNSDDKAINLVSEEE